jgi:hypothetical protein
MAGLVAVVGAAAAVAVVVLRSPHPTVSGRGAVGSPHAGRHAGRPAVAAAGTPLPSPSPPPVSPQQAAANLAGLLASSVADRSSVVNAVADISNCGPGLRQDPRVFGSAAASRQRLLGELASMPGRSALPASLPQELTSAWQASAVADQDFAHWARDELSHACVPNDHADPGYQAATGPDNQATAAKKAFARSWQPIAGRYGLHTYRWDQL